MIYFIQAEDGGPIKIGTTIRLAQRLTKLATEHRKGLRVLAIVDGHREEEQALHRRFDHLRIEGEWFDADAALIGFIASEGRPWKAEDDAPENQRLPIVVLKGTVAYRDWLVEATRKHRVPMPVLIDQLIAKWAAEVGQSEPPNR